jgi:hypothetical protein
MYKTFSGFGREDLGDFLGALIEALPSIPRATNAISKAVKRGQLGTLNMVCISLFRNSAGCKNRFAGSGQP